MRGGALQLAVSFRRDYFLNCPTNCSSSSSACLARERLKDALARHRFPRAQAVRAEAASTIRGAEVVAVRAAAAGVHQRAATGALE